MHVCGNSSHIPILLLLRSTTDYRAEVDMVVPLKSAEMNERKVSLNSVFGIICFNIDYMH